MRKLLSFIFTQSLFAIILSAFWIILFIIVITKYINPPSHEKYHITKNQNITKSNNKYILQNVLDLHSELSLNTINYSPTNSSRKQILDLSHTTFYSSYGAINALYNDKTQNYTVYLNQAPITQVENPIVEYIYNLNNQHVVMIFQETITTNNYIYSILDITQHNSSKLTEVGNFEELISAELNNTTNSCIFMKFRDARLYTDAEDYQVYQYCGNGTVSKVSDVKSDAHYLERYSNYMAKNIYELAEQDQCWDNKQSTFILNHKCGYAIKYCYIFQAIKNKNENDEYYNKIKNACQNRNNIVTFTRLNTSNIVGKSISR